MPKPLLLLLVGVVLAGAVLYALRGRGGAPEYVLVPVERGDIEVSVSALGALQARDYVDVGAQVSGQLTRIHVAEGDQVTAGQLLADIDPVVLRSRVEADQAQIRNLEAQRAERSAQRTQHLAQVARSGELHALDATSTQELEAAQTALAVVDAQLKQLGAQLDQARSTLRADEANLGYTRILAPVAGTVVSITARQGQTLNANQTTPIILRIADLSTMTVWTQISEADIGQVRPGMAVYFTTLGDTQRRWQGTLRQVLPEPELLNNVVLYRALVDVPNPDGLLRLQMTAQVQFVLASTSGVLRLPAAALGSLPEGARSAAVRVLVKGRPQPRKVDLGLRSRQYVEIRSGLAENDQVIVGERGATPARAADPRADRARMGMPRF